MDSGPRGQDGATSLRAWIGVGSNVGDRTALIEQALAAIDAHPSMRVVARSSLHETEPVGGPPAQGRYLNAAAEVAVALDATGAATARRLLDELLRIERSLGRVRDPLERNAPRTIDLDLLLVEAAVPPRTRAPLVLHEPGLELPHPRLHERRFALAPLAEIARELRHPLLGVTIGELLERLPEEAAGSADPADPAAPTATPR